MKVLMIGNIPVDMQSAKGGVESAILNLIDGFKKMSDIQLKIVSFKNKAGSPTSFNFSKNIEIYQLPVPGVELLSILFTERKYIKRIIKDFRPDLIHFQGSGPHLLSLIGIGRSNIVVTLHGVLREEMKHQNNHAGKIKFVFKTLIDAFYLKTFRNFIFISEYNRKQIHFKRAVETIIPNAINSIFFSIPRKKEFTGRLIYTGVINQRKNLMLLLKALNELKRRGKVFTLDVVGGTKEPNYKTMIDNYIIDHDLSDLVRFHGWVPQHEIGGLLQQADILVLPSRQESLPICIAEAMAAGKLIVATRVGGIPEMIFHHVSGFLFEKDNETALIEILVELYDNPGEVAQIAMKGVQMAKANYKSENVAFKTVGIL